MQEKPTLKRTLGLPAGILLVAGLMIGTGVFKKIAPMAQSGIGEPYIMIAWTVAGIVTMLGALTYSGLSGLTTETGGVYEYLRLMFGEFTAFLYGWTVFTIIGSGSIATSGFIFFQSASSLVHFPEPLAAFKDFAIGPLHPFAGTGVKLSAIALISLLTWINCMGVKKGSNLNSIVTVIKITGILVLVTAGLLFAYRHPRAQTLPPTPNAPPGFFLVSGVFGAMLSALYAYDGWANITFVTGEIKNPGRNLPFAILAGTGLVMVLYVLLNFTYMKVIPLSGLANTGADHIAAADVADRIAGRTGNVLMSVFIMVSGFGALNACIIVFARVYYRMAKENVFFRSAAAVHPRFRTPHIALVFSAAWCAVLVIGGSFETISNMVIFSGFIFFGITAWGLIRMKQKGIIRNRVVGYPVAPVIIILFCIALTINTMIRQPLISLTSLGLVACGAPFFLYFRRKKKPG